jgi:chaperonin GroEL (HSP60 family)
MIKGIVVDKEVLHSDMPKKISDAKIALINAALEIEKTETSAEIRITSPDQLQAFMDEEEKMLKKIADTVKKSGANVIFCQKGIDDLVAHYLAKEGIMAARRLKKSDMEKLAKATGGKVVTNIHELSPDDLGYAGLVEEQKIAKDEMIFVEDCKNPKSVTIFLRAGTSHVAEDLERSMHDAISVAAAVYQYKGVVPGGGAVETELSRRLQEFAGSVGGREQLAVKAFAEALEVIPRTLAENAGLDPIDILVKLREKHSKDGVNFGLDVFKGEVVDMEKAGVLEPARVIEQAIKSASEAAVMIIRIDDVIAATELRRPEMPEGGPGMGGMGMGGMPPM